MPTATIRLPDATLRERMVPYRMVQAERRRTTLMGVALLLIAAALAGWVAEIDMGKLLQNAYRFTDYLKRIFFFDTGASVFSDLGEWFWGLSKWTRLLIDTILIAYLGTFFGAIFAFFLCFAASANLARHPGIRFLTRRFLEFCRTVPEIVFALIFVVAFGLGPVPGVLAIMIHTTGALGKLFAEVVENIDMKPVDGITAAGGNRWQAIRYAVVPQVLPNFASYGLLRFEVNVRGASVMGFVGAGGIGQDLVEAIRKFYYADVSAILLLVIATVVVIDLLTETIRHRFIASESGR
jgi:phosphonate transport system permease protein